MRFAIVIFCAVILLLLAGVLPVGHGMSARAVYYSPMMILLLALLSGGSVWCCIRALLPGKRRLKAGETPAIRTAGVPPVPKPGNGIAGFILVHLGVVIILAGALTGYIAGTKGTLQLSLKPSRPVSKLSTQNGRTVDFGFEVAAENFEVQFYPPVYKLFRPLPRDQVKPGQMPFEQAGELNTEGTESWRVGGGEFTVSNLWKNGEWAERYRLDDGSVLFRGQQTPAFYGVTLLVGGQKLSVSINHPADYKGWRFYLVSYDQRTQRSVTLSARRDPGRGAVVAGIWIVMIGTFALCFRKTGGAA